MLFNELELREELLSAVDEKSYSEVTPIQEKAIPVILEGRDILGCARTGTGKTAAFALPLLQLIADSFEQEGKNNCIKALVLAPTRELAIQIGESFESYGSHLDIKVGVVFGGVTPKRHIKVLKKEPNILIATPGRLLDLVSKEVADLSHIQYLVLDEADRMLDLGMKKDVNKIISLLPNRRQNLLFSATIPVEVKKIVNAILRKPERITITQTKKDESNILQSVYFIEEPDKTALLLKLLQEHNYESVLVFVRTKKKADKVAKAINLINIRTKAIHGDKNQSERQKNLDLFKSKQAKILVATDVAARGIDIDNVSLVVNMDIPVVAETYIHRIGRTGRAGLKGLAVSFCSQDEKEYLEVIETLQNIDLTPMN